MNNKKAIFILLPCVCMLWAFIAFKVYNHVKPTELIVNESKFKELKFTNPSEKQKFDLGLNYTDPFLKNKPVFVGADKKATKGKGKSKTTKARTWSWPGMTYRGCIQNHKKVVGLLQINSREYLVREGMDLNGFLITKIGQDSLKIEREGELKTIGKTESK